MPLYTPNDRELVNFKNSFELKVADQNQIDRALAVREAAKKLGVLILQSCPDRKEKQLAMNALQEAVLWADAAMKNGEKGEVIVVKKLSEVVEP